MNHFIQVARRTGKVALGFKIQLVVHRMSAQLSNFNGAELVAVMTGHKKKAVTKSAAYQSAQKEVVWGDILPFSSTLYMAKTGLFQAKLFEIHVYDTRNDQQVATFEFNLAELVQSDKESSKENIIVATSKCQDPRASLSITVISSRVGINRSPHGHGSAEGSNADEMSFDDSRSDLSACTFESRASSHPVYKAGGTKHSTTTSQSSPGKDDPEGKANALRGGSLPVDETVATTELAQVKAKQQELVRTIQDLEEQLRQSESANVQLEKQNELKDAEIEQLREDKSELEQQIEELCASRESERKGRSFDGSDEDKDKEMSAEYAMLKEENERLKHEMDALKEAAKIAHPLIHKEEDEKEEEEEEDQADRHSEASSADEFQDAQEPHLQAEIQDLKANISTLREERESLQRTVKDLAHDNEQLRMQIADMKDQMGDLEATLAKRDAELAEVLASNDVAGDEEQQTEKEPDVLHVVKQENEKLMRQLNKLDHTITKLTDEKTSLADKVHEVESAHDRAKQDIGRAQKTIETLQSEKETLEDKLETAKAASDSAQKEVSAAEETISQLRVQVQEISAQLAATQQELHTLKHDELAASAAAAAAAVAKNYELQERWEELSSQNDQLQSRVEELEAKLEATEAREEEHGAELQREVDALMRETESLREDLDELRASKQQAEDELLTRTLELQEALENQRRLTVGHEERVGSLAMQSEEVRSRVEKHTQQAEATAQALNRQVETLMQENDYFQRELIDSKMKLAELTQQKDELTHQYKAMEKTVVEMQIKAAEKELKAKKK